MNSLKQKLKNINWLGVAKVVFVFVMAMAPLLFSAQGALAQTTGGPVINRFNCPANSGYRCSETDLPGIFNTIVNWALGIAFFIAVIFLIYGGFLYITSAGNEESATKGKNAVVYALIGIIIIVLSYVIVRVVYQFVVTGNAGSGGP